MPAGPPPPLPAAALQRNRSDFEQIYYRVNRKRSLQLTWRARERPSNSTSEHQRLTLRTTPCTRPGYEVALPTYTYFAIVSPPTRSLLCILPILPSSLSLPQRSTKLFARYGPTRSALIYQLIVFLMSGAVVQITSSFAHGSMNDWKMVSEMPWRLLLRDRLRQHWQQ